MEMTQYDLNTEFLTEVTETYDELHARLETLSSDSRFKNHSYEQLKELFLVWKIGRLRREVEVLKGKLE